MRKRGGKTEEGGGADLTTDRQEIVNRKNIVKTKVFTHKYFIYNVSFRWTYKR